MRRFNSFLFSLILTMMATPALASIPIGDYQFTFLSDTKLEARIVGPAEGTELSGDIVLPSKVVRPSNGLEYTVVEIGTAGGDIREELTRRDPFYNQPKITSVTIPETITYIWEEAFTACPNIKKFIVRLANPAYKSVDGVLYEKDDDGMAGDLIRFPPASELTSFKIGDRTVFQSARFIRYGAFRDNKNLKTLILGKRTRFSYGSFVGNLGIEKIEQGNSDYNVENGIVLSDDGVTLLATPPAYTKGKFTFPSSVKIINEYGCASLQASAVDFANVERIERRAFMGAAFKEVTVPATVTFMTGGTFAECHNLTTATINSKIKALPSSTFVYCEHLTEVNLPSSCKTLLGQAFKGCKALKTFSLANYVAFDDGIYVHEEHFAESGLVKMNWPSKVTTIPTMCFFKCGDLASLSLKETTEVIEDLAFYGTALETFNSGNLKEIQSYAFENCQKLRKIVFPESDHTLYLGTSSFPMNEDAAVFIDHKDIAYMGWAGEDWSSSFYGWDNGVVYTSQIRPKVFVDIWKGLYCPYGEKENFQKYNKWGTVREMFTVSRNSDDSLEVTPNYDWVKISDFTIGKDHSVDINFTAKDVKMHCVYPSDYTFDMLTSAKEVNEDIDVETDLRGLSLRIETGIDTECTVASIDGAVIFGGIISGCREIDLPSPGIYLLAAHQGSTSKCLKLIAR